MSGFQGVRGTGQFRRRFFTFGYNQWKQLPVEIGCPGGTITLHREDHGTVRVDFVPDGSRFADRLGEVETPAGGRQQSSYTVRLICEEVKKP